MPRLLLCLATTAIAGLLAWGAEAERLFGAVAQPSVTYRVDVPTAAFDQLSPRAIEDTWRARLRAYDVRTRPAPTDLPDAVGVYVEVIGADPDADAPDALSDALTGSAHFRIVAVVDGSPAMAAWGAAVEAAPEAFAGVSAQADRWPGPDGRDHHDTFLAAPSRAALERAVTALTAQHPLPEGTHIAYEDVITPFPPDGGPRPRPYVRTYLVDDAAVLAGEDVASTAIAHDPDSLHPEVVATLTPAAAVRFGDATARRVGGKLAIVLDDDVLSAPVVGGAIHGGRVAIQVPGLVPELALDAAHRLAAVLGARATLPDGIEATIESWRDRPVAVIWAARAGLALAAGALAWVVAGLARRRRWFAAAPAVSPGPARWRGLALPAAITVGVPALLHVARSHLLLPGVNRHALDELRGFGGAGAGPDLSVFALGLMPVVSGFLLVELVAIALEALLPERRGRRLGTAADRRRLDTAALVVAAALALVQGHFIAEYLGSVGGAPFTLFPEYSRTAHAVVMLSLAAGVIVHVLAAELISRHSLASGYLVVLGAASVEQLGPLAATTPAVPGAPAPLLLLALALAAALATAIASRLRSTTATGGGPRLPYTGVVPAVLVRGGVALLALAALLVPALAAPQLRAQEWANRAELAAVLPLTALILLTVRQPWSRAGVIATIAFLAALVFLPFLVAAPFRVAVPLAEGVLLGVVVSELGLGLLARARLPGATTVLVVHDVARADAAADRLAAAGIAHAVLGARARAALRFLAAFAPIAVRVPAERSDEARALLAEP